MSTTEKAPADTAPNFDALFAAAVTEPISKKKAARERWTGEVPAGLRTLVKKAAGDGERVVLPCPDVATYDQVIAMAAAAAETEAPGKVVYGTARHNDDGGITHVTFTVGDKRGRKADAEKTPAVAAETETPAETEKPTAPATAPAGAKATGKAGATNK